ncbi:MAG: hypothetical protein AAF702_17530 [Chloroflexota bacterium]
MRKYLFSQCTLTKLDEEFGLRQIFSNPHLENWIQAPNSLSDYEQTSLHALRNLLTLNMPGWNEQELSLHFIGPLLSLAQFTEPYRFNLFAGREISAVVPSIHGDEIELSGKPDGIIATGYREPRVPMFAFSEYKRQLDPEGDPAGQTLGAMLAGQHLNKKPSIMYGAYVIGSDWRFMVLEEKNYIISRDHSALSDEVYDILRILKTLKQIVVKLTDGT